MQPAAIGKGSVGNREKSEGAGDRRIDVARRLTVFAVGAWLVAAFVAGTLGVVNEPGRPPLMLAGFLAVPILGFVLWYWASPSFRAFTETIPLSLLVGRTCGGSLGSASSLRG